MMKKYLSLLSVMLVSVFLVSCASTQNQGYVLDKQKLSKRSFALVSVNGKEIKIEKAPTLEFDENLGIFGGICNRFFGQAELKDSVLTAKQLMSTNMFCAESGLMDLESKFFQMLASGAKITMQKDRLTLIQGDNTLVYAFKGFIK
ncbi:META domain-containing protein [Desulfovibrio litoralis]|uniref:Heat shock protein HslJ n=1 Tax=Desulfovibrio litoralis DSM 11393 TaxID=1121455 RepID=A0A1M7SMJ6_9BACT|nr:META domain-containing protein [Desulfovibrio litoralis]SHN59692.1 heat shock protein HslJ [Desulfovibrio litoralis DSM 11393]